MTKSMKEIQSGDNTRAGLPLRLTVDEVSKIAAAYAVTRSIKQTATLTGYNYNTVSKYVNEGDASRGIPSAKDAIAQSYGLIGDSASVTVAKGAMQGVVETLTLFEQLKSLASIGVGALLKRYAKAVQSGDEKEIIAAENAIVEKVPIDKVLAITTAENQYLKSLSEIMREKGARASESNRSKAVDEVILLLRSQGVRVDESE